MPDDHEESITQEGRRRMDALEDYPKCSGDPASCPENEGYGCCKPNPKQGE